MNRLKLSLTFLPMVLVAEGGVRIEVSFPLHPTCNSVVGYLNATLDYVDKRESEEGVRMSRFIFDGPISFVSATIVFRVDFYGILRSLREYILF